MDLLHVSLAFLAILDVQFYIFSDSVPCSVLSYSEQGCLYTWVSC